MLFSGKLADLSPSCKQETIALDVLNDSDPPRKITALPDFKHKPPASAVTFGLDS